VRYLLDTNICIYIIKRRPKEVLRRFREVETGDIGISSVTLSELYFGAAKSAFPKENRLALESFVMPLGIQAYDAPAAAAYGEVRADLERKGTPIGSMDLLIAAHAISLRAVLVTNNTREFRRVRGLSVDNWCPSR